MALEEGVIKYQLEFTRGSSPLEDEVKELNAWRNLFYRLNMIGQEPNRYGGFGYGNVSQRVTRGTDDGFIISASQTGHIQKTDSEHYVYILGCDLVQNKVSASGAANPSSEALTHGALYQANPEINFVFHVHCPELWLDREVLEIPATDAEVEYGTPEMAKEIKRCLVSGDNRDNGIIAMAGHEDGIISYGDRADRAGDILIRFFLEAMKLK